VNNKIFIKVVMISMLFVCSSLKAEYVVLDSIDDAEVDSYIDFRDIALSAYAGMGAFTELRIERYDPNFYPEDPGATFSNALIRWDLSGISSNHRISNVTLEMSSWYSYQGQVAVYGIQAGNWDEDTVTWNIWEATPKTLVFLGNLTPAGSVETYGRTTFSDPDLTAWVQSWVDGSQANYGIILKMPDGAGFYGTSFSSREDTYVPPSGLHLYYAPQLKISHELATSSINGRVIIDGYTGDMSIVGAQVVFQQNGSSVRTEHVLLDASGNFSVSDIGLGTYNIIVNVCSQLQKTSNGVALTTVNPVNLGDITFHGGDFEGNGVVNSKDLKILANNWLSEGD
jgi:hypothetical protein